MRILVTGSHGFVGTHLRAALRGPGVEVTGAGIGSVEPGEGETCRELDLRDAAAVRALVHDTVPDVVYHLAAVAGHGAAAEAAREAVDVNVLGTRNLMDALAERGGAVRVVHMGSSAQYGAIPARCDPVDEDAPQCPLGVYGWSKTASEAVAMAYDGRAGIEVVGARPFNQTGPGEPPHLVAASFARQIAAVEAGAEPVIRVGDLSPVRDFTDVRDTVRGLLALATRGAHGRVYNLCSGRGVAIRDVLALLLDKTGVSIEVRADPARMRPVDLPRQVGDAARARRDTGWAPGIGLSTSLSDVLDEWRSRRDVPVKGSRP
jgi:GDP-4-dehydro-6-deoxy-D-mannose reductase